MTRNKKIIIFGIVAIILLMGFLVYIKSTNHSIELPKNDFDAIYQIPDTNIFFKYPSAGFYGLGVRIATSTGVEGSLGGVGVGESAEYKEEARSAYVTLNIDLLKNDKNFASIDDFAKDFQKESSVAYYDHTYAKENGHFLEINGRRYFIYKVTEDATAWIAYTFDKGGILQVRLAYTGNDQPYSGAIYKNNDKLFLEILENIHFVELPAFSNNKSETVINSLWQILNDSFLNVNFSEPKNLYQWWVSDDGWSIAVPGAPSIISKDIRGSSVKPLDPKAKELNYFISSIFLANNFAPNATNTSKSEEEPWLEFYDYIVAFQKGETRCTLTTNSEAWEYTVTCSNSLQKAYEEQIPYLKALDRRDVIVNVREGIGDFVWLDVHPRRTGNLALMKDEGEGKMKLIFSGQEAPPCDLMIENEVPKEVYGTCNDAWKSIQNNSNDQE